MPTSIVRGEITDLCNSLDSLAKAVLEGWSGEAIMLDQWGWNCPALTRHELSRLAGDLATAIRERAPEVSDSQILQRLAVYPSRIEKFKSQTLPYIWNGHAATAVPPYLALLASIRGDLEPLLGWEAIRDTNLLPPKLARRIRAYQAQLDEIAPNKEELEKQIASIKEATEAAESLPTDLEALAAARKKIEKAQNDSLLLHSQITGLKDSSIAAGKKIEELETQAAKLVEQCEQAYRITTTKGLAAAFDQRAKWLAVSMWVWVIALICALGVGYWLGSNHLKNVIDALKSSGPEKANAWVNGILALFSFGAPVWLAWIATKQIGQRFRLAEDYAFKASVAKAYEGYRKEAARIDTAFESRLFASALTRLEEAPLRLMEEKTHGSPWHELIESDAFRDALRAVPGLREQLNKVRKKMGRKQTSNADQTESLGDNP